MALEDEQGATADLHVDEQVSMDDTIRTTLNDIKSRGDESTADNAESKPAEAPEEAAARIRDQQGKFAKAAVAAPAEGAPVDPAAQQAAVDAAPNTWKKEAAAEWAKLPPSARAEIQRREADFHKGIEGYKEAAGFGQTMRQVVAPHMQTLQALGVAPEAAISNLMATEAKLRYGSPQEKAAEFARLAEYYQIPMDGVQQRQEQLAAIPPEYRAMEQQNAQYRQMIEQQNMSVQQQQEAALNSEISTFAADPAHSHFESVKGHMSALLQAGQAKDLSDAYEQAVYANPTTRAVMLQQQTAAALAEKTKAAQAAKASASINVARRPAIASAPPVGTMDDTIRNTLRRIQGA